MKQFAIYQFFIDTNFNERSLLVGFVKADSHDDAVNQYAESKYKPSHIDFIKRYLYAQETRTESITNDLLLALPKNAKELGAWYSEGLC